MKKLLFVGAPVLLALLAACSTDSALSPSASLTLSSVDTAQAAVLSASDATAEDVDLMLASDLSVDAGAYSASMGTTTLGSSLDLAPSFSTTSSTDTARVGFWAFSSACAFVSSTGRFTCPDVDRKSVV